MSSDNELNWMTSPQHLRGIKTGLTCLDGAAVCFTAAVVTQCGCARWAYNVENGSKEMEWEGLDWMNSARRKERWGAEMNMAMQWRTQIFSLGGGGGGPTHRRYTNYIGF
jgi:hypothetical protein